jgi:hypothetical protein
VRRHEQRAPHLVLELSYSSGVLHRLNFLCVFVFFFPWLFPRSLFTAALFSSPSHSLSPFVPPFYPVRVLTTEPLTLTDDNILIQMGSTREGQTEEEKETYLAGLKEIINDLRRDKVKDFNTVAAEIAAYRRRFLQDPSRVLSL